MVAKIRQKFVPIGEKIKAYFVSDNCTFIWVRSDLHSGQKIQKAICVTVLSFNTMYIIENIEELYEVYKSITMISIFVNNG